MRVAGKEQSHNITKVCKQGLYGWESRGQKLTQLELEKALNTTITMERETERICLFWSEESFQSWGIAPRALNHAESKAISKAEGGVKISLKSWTLVAKKWWWHQYWPSTRWDKKWYHKISVQIMWPISVLSPVARKLHPPSSQKPEETRYSQ